VERWIYRIVGVLWGASLLTTALTQGGGRATLGTWPILFTIALALPMIVLGIRDSSCPNCRRFLPLSRRCPSCTKPK
jgi:hypothetical protein